MQKIYGVIALVLTLFFWECGIKKGVSVHSFSPILEISVLSQKVIENAINQSWEMVKDSIGSDSLNIKSVKLYSMNIYVYNQSREPAYTCTIDSVIVADNKIVPFNINPDTMPDSNIKAGESHIFATYQGVFSSVKNVLKKCFELEMVLNENGLVPKSSKVNDCRN